MNPLDLMNHYECKTRRALSQKIGFSEVTLWKWEKKGIPPRTQALFEILTEGKLKADRQALIN
ncbi:hypothetical protein ACFODO_23935 [Acinetobacter sichuanensis]|uniref:Uncharacterized protein n=1 Tax=Acinetobacter sichuanensis TaxID=2136183 RepID=A0A371YIR0_9GAMM|nr:MULTISPECIES: hypothetical protein [Acinetobacter]MDM1766066.1 hypothetical protein [Acinetobacter sp. 226-1]MDM1769816.1 hypothetical protein [Acinetobacter sp. 226-4]RFC81369.1 hypothetical protein C9E89_022255 [Acinetobacter sichuanensis]